MVPDILGETCVHTQAGKGTGEQLNAYQWADREGLIVTSAGNNGSLFIFGRMTKRDFDQYVSTGQILVRPGEVGLRPDNITCASE